MTCIRCGSIDGRSKNACLLPHKILYIILAWLSKKKKEKVIAN